MYKSNKGQLNFKDFTLPFAGELQGSNRWVLLANAIPWGELEPLYIKSLTGSHTGSPAKSFRIALGSLIIKERLGTTDEETVEQIQENPYLQYFLGFSGYQHEAPFEASMYVHFRKRMSPEILDKVTEILACDVLKKNKKSQEAQIKRITKSLFRVIKASFLLMPHVLQQI